MVQFKPFFTGAVELPYTRATSSQKCLRTTDLENVGKTERHCTFFEMLGNFSFGDYFKKEAIEYALEFSTKYLEFPIEKIWVTVYLDDDEAIEMWVNSGIPRERIVKLGKADNFWGPAGDSGACGPCSELYLDRGIEKGGKDCGTKATCKPGCDCDRFLEYWNLVFNQFNQDTNGVLHPLKQTGIDTGSGLERVALLSQNVDSVYDTDQLQRIIKEIEKLTSKFYEAELKSAFRVLTDHSRSISFAIGDGIYPDKTGRGYIIRRLIRRAALYARKLGVYEPILYKLVNTVVSIYKEEYPVLLQKKSEIEKIVWNEEKLFLNTLEIGLSQMESMLESNRSKNISIFSGKDLFKLYGTYGFPFEMTKEILEEKGIPFNKKEFDEEFEKDRQMSRESWKGKKSSLLAGSGIEKISPTRFVGYETTESKGKLLHIIKEGKSVSKVSSGEECILILDESSFYGESGGQIGDIGFIKTNDCTVQVLDTQKENDVILHIGVVLQGNLEIGTIVQTLVDNDRRRLLTYHHSGTHLLHSALRKTLGTHVSQKASLVSNEYLRFDFSHPEALEDSQILQIEESVNQAIGNSYVVQKQEMDFESAKKTGAIAFFEDKYGDRVRVVSMADYSVELCGGCHVDNTSEIKYFLIKKESSPGAGNRRIEAVCGEKVEEYFQEEFQKLSQEVNELNLKTKEIFQSSEHFIAQSIPSPEEIHAEFSKKGSVAVKEMRAKKKELELSIENTKNKIVKEKKRLEAKESANLLTLQQDLLQSSMQVGKFKVIKFFTSDKKIDALKELGDSLKNTAPESFLFFVNSNSGSDTILLMAGKQAVSSGVNCNTLLKKANEVLGGKGGGKPDLAQGSGKNHDKLEEAFQKVAAELKILN
jgi:alanyl-tRNA synthetase